ncbi:hypothetical protein JQ604_12195 [Bradyrhizobium jicamae]|uniref:hypothetical protein n=1 Tax=Bradyrhizobium jicamae TaxID=280332 RepID=UPI001BAE19FB|nr:hypothetical protein [Bradyrhizobium jicamae]MBR0752947.1 hypothetical protein [Bradyrhizobium jicamae]
MTSTPTSAGHAAASVATIRDGLSEPAAANIIPLPFSRERYLIVQTRTDCEALRQNVNVVVECIAALKDFLERVDDVSVREEFRPQLDRLNELLLVRLDQLSAADRLLREMLPYT